MKKLSFHTRQGHGLHRYANSKKGGGDMAYVYWITGLSGAGKTSVGKLLYKKMKQKYQGIVFLDGDVLREVFGNDLGYTREERIKCAMRYARLCRMLQRQGLNVICCTISMFDEIRNWNRENIENYREIYVRVSMEVLKKRNKKGLYSSSARKREVAGIQVEIEEPKNPDMILDNEGNISVSELVDKVIERYGI